MSLENKNIPKPKTEDYLYQENISDFFDRLNNIPSIEKMDKKYAKLYDIYREYEVSFAPNPLVYNSIVYRLKKYTEINGVDSDVVKEAVLDSKHDELYLININNKKLLREVFTPSVNDEKLEEVIKDVNDMHALMEFRDNTNLNPVQKRYYR